MEKGDVFVISAPSGSGKTTICRMLAQRVENIQLSVSYTTRPRKEGEVDGKDYYFVKPEIFDKMIISREFLESASVEMKARLRAAADEARHLLLYDYLVVNDDLGAAVTRVEWIVRAARLRRGRGLVRVSEIGNRPGEGG